MNKKTLILTGICIAILASSAIYALYNLHLQRPILPIPNVNSYPVIIDDPEDIFRTEVLIEARSAIIGLYGVEECFIVTRYGNDSNIEPGVDIRIDLNDDGIFSTSLKQAIIDIEKLIGKE